MKVLEVIDDALKQTNKASQEGDKITFKEFIVPDQFISDVTSSLKKIKSSKDFSKLALTSLNGIEVNLNLDKATVKAFIQEELGYLVEDGLLLFNTQIVKLEPQPKDWFGTIVSVFVATVAIAVSFIRLLGFFWGAIMKSLLAKGIGDLFNAAVAVITNNPINLNAYLKSSAMSMGIAVVTAGALFCIDKAFGGLQMLDGIAGRTRDAFGNKIIPVNH